MRLRTCILFQHIKDKIINIYLHVTNVLLISFSTGNSFKSSSTRLTSAILITWLVVCVIITATYSANLIAFLSVEKYHVPFNTFRELSNQNQYQFGTLGGASTEIIFKVLKFLNKKKLEEKSYIFTL